LDILFGVSGYIVLHALLCLHTAGLRACTASVVSARSTCARKKLSGSALA